MIRTRLIAAVAAVGVALCGSVVLASGASSAENPIGPVVVSAPVRVDPQPVVAGHEGDVLMRVNVVMASTATQPATAAKVRKPARHAHRH